MDSRDIENILSVTDMVARFGIPMVLGIINTIKDKSPTISEIHKLRMSIKDPEEYFNDDGSIKIGSIKTE